MLGRARPALKNQRAFSQRLARSSQSEFGRNREAAYPWLQSGRLSLYGRCTRTSLRRSLDLEGFPRAVGNLPPFAAKNAAEFVSVCRTWPTAERAFAIQGLFDLCAAAGTRNWNSR